MIGFIAAFEGCRRMLSPSRKNRFSVASVESSSATTMSPLCAVFVFSTSTNRFVLHGFAAHFEHEHFLRAHKIRQRNGFVVLHRLNRMPRRNPSHQRQHP